MDEFNQLNTVAEIAITIAGFAAIIVMFKQRNDGTWQAGDADRFHGMLLHAFTAAFFCFVPDVLFAFTDDLGLIWSISSFLLAAQILAHIIIIARLSTSNRYTRLSLVLPLAVAAVLAFNAFGGDGIAEYRPYLLGILWHTFQAAFLFFRLVMIPDSKQA